MKRLLGMTALAVVLAAGSAQAQSVKIGVLSDMSSLYADIGGPSTVLTAVGLGLAAWWALVGSEDASPVPASAR